MPYAVMFKDPPAPLALGDIFTVCGEGASFPDLMCHRDGLAPAGVTASGYCVDADGNLIPDLNRQPFTKEENAELDRRRAAYVRSMSCDPD